MNWYNENTDLFMKRGYLGKNQTIHEKIKEISDHAEKILGKKGFSEKLSKYIEEGYYVIPTPVWKNFNPVARESAISCFGVFIDDSVESILLKAAEIGIQNKIGGGSSGTFEAVRPRGAKIGEEGESNGSVSMMEIFQTISTIISQPNRRGHFSATQNIDHFDADEFLRLRSEGHPIQDLSFSVSISDKFMNNVLDGCEKEIEKLRKIVKCRYETGFPYIFFSDTVNRNTVDVYKENDMKIWHSNMCVTPETLILTDKGYVEIQSVSGTYQNVWNGEEFSRSKVWQTGLWGAAIYKVSTNRGTSLDCTRHHRFFVYDQNGVEVTKRCDELKKGDRLIDFKLPDQFNGQWKDVPKEPIIITDVRYIGLNKSYCFREPKKGRGMFNGILTSNCHEISLPNTTDETFVCNLLGMNIEKFDEWKDTDVVEVGIYFMDAMLTDFIDKNKDNKLMTPAVTFARRHRAMGMGASGYHNYLQSKMIPFESMEAKIENSKIFKTIKEQAYKASEKMATEYGKPELLDDPKYLRRHTTLLAVAPNTSSSFIIGQQSQSIEPHVSNYYVKDVAKTRISVKNKYLEQILEKKGKNTKEVWKDILKEGGSVQHLSFLTNEEKKVFKTFGEISQLEILQQASARQKFIDQSQSLNLMIPENVSPEDVTYLIIKAWKLGIKTLYYQLNVSAVQEFGRKNITECESCAG